MPILRSLGTKTPRLAEPTWCAETAQIIGDVEVGRWSTLWYQTVLRGDVMPIRIGEMVNVQDGTVIHGTFGAFGTTLEDRVTIGHSVVLHGCEVQFESLVGMGAIIMDGAQIGRQSLVGAGSLVTAGQIFPPQSLILGRPAKRIRELTPEEVKNLSRSADNYLFYASWYSEDFAQFKSFGDGAVSKSGGSKHG